MLAQVEQCFSRTNMLVVASRDKHSAVAPKHMNKAKMQHLTVGGPPKTSKGLQEMHFQKHLKEWTVHDNKCAQVRHLSSGQENLSIKSTSSQVQREFPM